MVGDMNPNISSDAPPEQQLLEEVRILLLSDSAQEQRFQQLLQEHHYLGGLKPVGERLSYVALDAQGNWVALLLFCAAARHLKHRDRWIGWTPQQRERRLGLVANQSRFLTLPNPSVPNLGTRVLSLTLARLSQDWQERYGHPILVVETFVDPEHFSGTVYTANGWTQLGLTDGWGRRQREFYLHHDRPKWLLVRELVPNACRSLQAEHLKPSLAHLEKKVPKRCYYKSRQIQAFTEHFKAVPEYRRRIESYPVWSLLTLMLLAMLCESPRGQKDLVKLARHLTQAQRRALGIRRNRHGFFPAPSQSTFSRLFSGLDVRRVNETLLAIQRQVRGDAPAQDLIVLDGKEPRHGPGHTILSAVTGPSLFYLGSALVETKTNEIPVARVLFHDLDLAGRTVVLDALHTQDQTARELVMEHGAHYLLTVKGNRPTLLQNITTTVPVPPTGFSPSGINLDPSPHGGEEQGQTREPHD